MKQNIIDNLEIKLNINQDIKRIEEKLNYTFDKRTVYFLNKIKNKNYFVAITFVYQTIDKNKIEFLNEEKIKFIEQKLTQIDVPFNKINFYQSNELERTTFYLNEKSFSKSEFLLRSKGIFLIKDISIVSSFYNESRNIINFWNQLVEVDRLLEIKEFIFVDNGSIDDTYEVLKRLSTIDKRILIIRNPKPSNYSLGFSKGISISKSKFTLITHSDCQINLYNYIRDLLYNHSSFGSNTKSNKIVYLSYRLNRKLDANLITLINNFLAKIFLNWPKLIDFNSQPKIIPTFLLKNFSCSDGYLFDIKLMNKIIKYLYKKKIYLAKFTPVIVNDRIHGESSWAETPYKFFTIMFSYLKFISLNIKLFRRRNK